MTSRALYASTLFVSLSVSCSAAPPDEPVAELTQAAPGRPAGGITVDTTILHQVIRGFGGATVWNGALTEADADKLFGTLGLSICRIRIAPDGNWSDEIANAQKAYARGARVVSSTWSPPAWMKSNNNTVGGFLLPENYGAYASWINSFVSTLATNGVPLYAASVQNEPNSSVDYESTTWTAEEMRAFMADYAGEIDTRVMMPETFNYLPSYGDVILDDPAAAAHTDICAFHWYGANRFRLWTKAFGQGKDIWMTEVYDDDQSLGAAISTAEDIISFLTVDQCNAYVWWYVKAPSCNLVTDTGINPRGYVMGQFARFVRPGFVRVDVAGSNTAAAFKSGSTVVIVDVNSRRSAATHTFDVKGETVTSMTPHVTDAEHNMEALAPISVSGGSFTATVSGNSVTTFVSD
ncbi:MAG: glucuronoxylanase XynC [Gemmatimonadota bacterium]